MRTNTVAQHLHGGDKSHQTKETDESEPDEEEDPKREHRELEILGIRCLVLDFWSQSLIPRI